MLCGPAAPSRLSSQREALCCIILPTLVYKVHDLYGTSAPQARDGTSELYEQGHEEIMRSKVRPAQIAQDRVRDFVSRRRMPPFPPVVIGDGRGLPTSEEAMWIDHCLGERYVHITTSDGDMDLIHLSLPGEILLRANKDSQISVVVLSLPTSKRPPHCRPDYLEADLGGRAFLRWESSLIEYGGPYVRRHFVRVRQRQGWLSRQH